MAPVEIHRTVNAVGTVPIAGKSHSIGQPLACRRITLRLETTLAHVIVDRVLARTIPLTLGPAQRARLPGACTPIPAQTRISGPPWCSPPCPAAAAPKSFGQRVQVGLRYVGLRPTLQQAPGHGKYFLCVN